jgi:DedD protein
MGLFSRNESASKSTRRNGSREATSSDAQAKELRGRARRRLIGALVLVVAAIIVLPMLFDNSSNMRKTPVVTQVTIPPGPSENTAVPDNGALVAQNGAGQAPLPVPDVSSTTSTSGQPSAETSNPADQNAGSQAPGQGAGQQSDKAGDSHAAASGSEKAAKKNDAGGADDQKKNPDSASAPSKASKDKSGSKTDTVKRTDDGSVALALLQGRTPSQAKSQNEASDKGDYVLQIAAYTTEQDAQSRRDKLVAAGVTNAYVERAVSSGKTIYRLRVGPFASRDSAQAAQARLRALGYDNGFISSK